MVVNQSEIPPVEKTLTRVVVLMRVLGFAWLVLLVVTTAINDNSVDGVVLVATAVLGAAGTAFLFVAVRRGFLGQVWFMVVDGVVSGVLLMGGWLAGAEDFVAGGYPMSWVFVLAYTTNFLWTVGLASLFTLWFAALHLLMGLEPVRIVGSIQFVVIAVIVGWAFENLRERESMRLRAEAERGKAQAELATEREAAAVLEQRTRIARDLHDSVLQTFKLIASSADDPDEVRYLTRVQERELRKTINEYRSPHADSFRARLLDARAAVEDRYRVEVEQVIRGDGEMTDPLEALVGAAKEAMANAARHSGSPTIDLYAEVSRDGARVSVRDRGVGFEPDAVEHGGVADSIVGRVEEVGGTAEIKSAPGAGTDVSLFVPNHD